MSSVQPTAPSHCAPVCLSVCLSFGLPEPVCRDVAVLPGAPGAITVSLSLGTTSCYLNLSYTLGKQDFLLLGKFSEALRDPALGFLVRVFSQLSLASSLTEDNQRQVVGFSVCSKRSSGDFLYPGKLPSQSRPHPLAQGFALIKHTFLRSY